MNAQAMTSEPKRLGPLAMMVASIAVGSIAGLGAVVFRGMIGLFHNILFLGEFSVHYNANVHTLGSPFGAGVILVPVIGAVGVAFLVKTFAPEAKGHGVPEVMDAIYYQKGHIRPIVAVVKSVASALSIGSGGSVGREGPIIQIGSAFGSTLGQIVPMPVHQRTLLIACGAGGGIAATFNTPIGGVLFAIELMLPTVGATSLMPLVLATVTATYIGRYFLGLYPSFNIPELAIPATEMVGPLPLATFILFGILIGLLATLFVRSIYWFEDRFDAMPGNYYTRHMLGMLIVGIMIYALYRFTGQHHYYVQGVGYATIVDVLDGTLTGVGLLILLAAAKLLATGLTLGSGASGGVFSPCLFLGAAVGGACGLVFEQVWPDAGYGPAAFAIAGMAGMVAGTTGAVVTAIAMLFEMTRDYSVILPVIITAGVALWIRKSLSDASIYTLKLLRRGHVVPEGLVAALDSARRARDVMNTQFERVQVDAAEADSSGGTVLNGSWGICEQAGQVVDVRPPSASGDKRDGKAASGGFITVGPQTRLVEILTTFETTGARIALVTRDGKSTRSDDVVGVIGPEEITRSLVGMARLVG